MKFPIFFLVFFFVGIVPGQKPVVIDSVIIHTPVLKGDPFFIWDAFIKNDSLCLDISYIGGKQNHIFKLFAYNRKIENNKYYMDLVLSHRANSDTHQSVISTTLRFDLSPLKRKHLFTNNTLYLNLYKLRALGKIQMLTYNF